MYTIWALWSAGIIKMKFKSNRCVGVGNKCEFFMSLLRAYQVSVAHSPTQSPSHWMYGSEKCVCSIRHGNYSALAFLYTLVIDGFENDLFQVELYRNFHPVSRCIRCRRENENKNWFQIAMIPDPAIFLRSQVIKFNNSKSNWLNLNKRKNKTNKRLILCMAVV